MVNFTADSFKKYDNVKISKFLKTLDQKRPLDYASQVASYFDYHVLRKNNHVEKMRD